MVDHGGPQLDPPEVAQVDHVANFLCLSPSSQLMDMEGHLLPIDKPPADLHPKPVKPGGVIPVPPVELHYPVIYFPDFLQPVVVARWWGASVWEPGQFWWVQQGGNYQLVLGLWVVAVLVIDAVLELEDAVGEGELSATPQQVVDASN